MQQGRKLTVKCLAISKYLLKWMDDEIGRGTRGRSALLQVSAPREGMWNKRKTTVT